MRKYRHMMEQVALSDRKKEEIMEQLEMNETKKRRMPKARTMILAAALAVGCLLSIAAAANLPGRVYNFLTGGQIYVASDRTYGSMTVGGDPEASFLRVEDGRLWFEADGQHIDITDKISEETPYIYERTDSVTGEKGCVVVGGTVENLGWIEFFVVDGKMQAGSGVNYFHLEEDQNVTGSGIEVVINSDDGTTTSEVVDCITGRIVERPWYRAALEQLGFEG